MAAKDNVDLICSIGELAGLFERTTSLDGFLQQAVSLVAYHMRAAVCSVYLLDEKAGELVLTANQGLSKESVGRVRLKLGEGITGAAVKELRPIRVAIASQSPLYKFIPSTEEEKFKAFLAVPIMRGLKRVGALVVQDPVQDYFDENDAKALQAIAAQLVTVIENAKLLMDIGRRETQETEQAKKPAVAEPSPKYLRGTAGANGWALGMAMVFGSLDDETDAPARCSCTRDDFLRALNATEKQLETLQTQMEERLADVASLIFSAHILMVKDPKFSGTMLALIESGVSPPAAISKVVDEYGKLFTGSKNPVLREKAQDVRDLGRRLLKNLSGATEEHANYQGRVIIAGELLPSDILRIAAQKAEGLVLVSGGVNSHIAILARSLQLPMVIIDSRDLLFLSDHDRVLVDGDQGALYVNPVEDVQQTYRALMQSNREADALAAGLPAEARTRDGTVVDILANINMLSEIKVALRYKAAGVGLYRSEFPFIVRNGFPSEEEQFRIYRKLIDDMQGRSVTLRTLDVGGDKMLSYFPTKSEANPFLGMRALRFSLRNKDIFTQQLRAMLRAGHGRDLRIMFPLVASVDDFIEARDVVKECIAGLQRDAVPHHAAPELGAMIETPSAVEVADELAAEADFLSIGGNDLVQYMLAVDRTNEHVSDLYVSHHPAVLRALHRIAAAAHRNKKPVSFCGEMAADSRLLPFLIGIGLCRVSVEARQIPRIHQIVAGLSAADCETLAARLLKLSRVRDVAAALKIA